MCFSWCEWGLVIGSSGKEGRLAARVATGSRQTASLDGKPRRGCKVSRSSGPTTERQAGSFMPANEFPEADYRESMSDGRVSDSPHLQASQSLDRGWGWRLHMPGNCPVDAGLERGEIGGAGLGGNGRQVFGLRECQAGRMFVGDLAQAAGAVLARGLAGGFGRGLGSGGFRIG